jgi:hypothetical protein
MYRILSKTVIFVGFAWLVVGIFLLLGNLQNFINFQYRITIIPTVAWIALSILLLNPVWRLAWRLVPPLNKWVFPDLNGKWRVELYSNWPRQAQLLDAAKSTEQTIDMRLCNQDELAELTPLILEAEIYQTWWSFDMRLHNPGRTSPIDKSDTITVDPFPRKGLQSPGIMYFYEQENDTDNVSDSDRFFGAARLIYDFDKDELSGLTWTARMWERAMNTAAKVSFTRISK